jgi:hypothetical protein
MAVHIIEDGLQDGIGLARTGASLVEDIPFIPDTYNEEAMIETEHI